MTGDDDDATVLCNETRNYPASCGRCLQCTTVAICVRISKTVHFSRIHIELAHRRLLLLN